MGYTHYYKGLIPPESSTQLLTDIQKLLSTSTTSIAGPSGSGDPILTESLVDLNGRDDPHEPFTVEIGHPIPFAFCKTARKPYDQVVGAVLLRCQFYSPHPGFEVHSDGSWDEWGPARELYRTAFGVEAEMPEGMRPSMD